VPRKESSSGCEPEKSWEERQRNVSKRAGKVPADSLHKAQIKKKTEEGVAGWLGRPGKDHFFIRWRRHSIGGGGTMTEKKIPTEVEGHF